MKWTENKAHHKQNNKKTSHISFFLQIIKKIGRHFLHVGSANHTFIFEWRIIKLSSPEIFLAAGLEEE